MAERRAASVHRFDTIHSPDYDQNWGTIHPSHAVFVARLAGLIRHGGAVLDAACGTGKYWPALPASSKAAATTTTRRATGSVTGWPPPGSPSPTRPTPTRPTPTSTGTCCSPVRLQPHQILALALATLRG